MALLEMSLRGDALSIARLIGLGIQSITLVSGVVLIHSLLTTQLGNASWCVLFRNYSLEKTSIGPAHQFAPMGLMHRLTRRLVWSSVHPILIQQFSMLHCIGIPLDITQLMSALTSALCLCLAGQSGMFA